jgi:hypothetical protein
MEITEVSISGYRYDSASLGHAHDYLLPSVYRLLDGLVAAKPGVGRVPALAKAMIAVARKPDDPCLIAMHP